MDASGSVTVFEGTFNEHHLDTRSYGMQNLMHVSDARMIEIDSILAFEH